MFTCGIAWWGCLDILGQSDKLQIRFSNNGHRKTVVIDAYVPNHLIYTTVCISEDISGESNTYDMANLLIFYFPKYRLLCYSQGSNTKAFSFLLVVSVFKNRKNGNLRLLRARWNLAKKCRKSHIWQTKVLQELSCAEKIEHEKKASAEFPRPCDGLGNVWNSRRWHGVIGCYHIGEAAKSSYEVECKILIQTSISDNDKPNRCY